MGAELTKALQGLQNRSTVVGDDVLSLRRAVYADGRVSADEIKSLLTLHRCGAAADAGDAWAEFFVEAVVDFFAYQREVPDWGTEYKANYGRAIMNVARAASPFPGHKAPSAEFDWRDVSAHLPDAHAQHLVAAVKEAGGFVLDAVERRVFKRLFERAIDYPESLSAFAFEAVKQTVKADGRVDADDVALLRAVFYGPAGDWGLTISRAEAEALFEIQAAARGGDNAAEWRDLFVKAVTMHVLFGGGSPDVVDGAEAEWLAERLGAPEAMDAEQQALVAYICKEAAAVSPDFGYYRDAA